MLLIHGRPYPRRSGASNVGGGGGSWEGYWRGQVPHDKRNDKIRTVHVNQSDLFVLVSSKITRRVDRYVEHSSEFSGMGGLAPLYHWNWGDYFVSPSKWTKNLERFFPLIIIFVIYSLYSAFTTRLWMRSIPCYTLPLEARAEERQIRTNLLVACVASESERDARTHARMHTKNTAAKDTAGVAGRLPLYPLEITQLWKIFITCKPVHIEEAGLLGCFEGLRRRYLQGYESVNWLITARMKAARLFEIGGSKFIYVTEHRRLPWCGF